MYLDDDRIQEDISSTDLWKEALGVTALAIEGVALVWIVLALGAMWHG